MNDTLNNNNKTNITDTEKNENKKETDLQNIEQHIYL